MSLPLGKVKLVFEVSPEEKQHFESLCKSLNITKIEFLRRAIAQAEKIHDDEKEKELKFLGLI